MKIRWALLFLISIAWLGCAGTGASSLDSLPPDSSSRAYPSVASGCACRVAFAPRLWFKRVIIIVLENQDYEKAIVDPYLGKLATLGASFTNFHGLFHPSYSNYLAMVAGKDIATVFDRQRDLNECTVADLLKSKGLTWRNYAEGYPVSPDHCFTNHFFAKGKYARKHVPFLSFKPIQQQQCSNIASADQFDPKALPAYAFYTPDMDNDGHDTGLAYASTWLKGFLQPLLMNQDVMEGTLVVVTFDESADQSEAAGNKIYTVFLGPMVQPGRKVEDNYSHYNVLRTIEENFGLCPLGEGDAGARPITDVWR